MAREFWTNESVLAFAGGRDPVEVLTQRARQVVLEAVQAGWEGPPFDPLELARLRHIPVVARDELPDARTVPTRGGALRIEFNPTRPPGRMRYSVAHEVAHTLFPDAADQIRLRSWHAGSQDDWQLELLCNIAAAEFVMPTHLFMEVETEQLDIESLMRIRKEYDVSTEALLRRVVQISSRPVAFFAASRPGGSHERPRYKIDYHIASPAWRPVLQRGMRLPAKTVISECTAVGYTAKGRETWSAALGNLRVEAVGVAPYPGDRYPRVVGLLHNDNAQTVELPPLIYVHGDATQPRGEGHRVIGHVVNDRTPNWGGRGSFAVAVRHVYPGVQDEFRRWVDSNPANLTLGNCHIVRLNRDLSIVSIVAQRGYGPSTRTRLHYASLRNGLQQLSQYALEVKGSVHVPAIGTGNAAANWAMVRELLEESVTRRGIPLTVYIPPGADLPDERPAQAKLPI